MRVNEDVRVNGNHTLPQGIDQVSNLTPVSLRYAWLKTIPLKSVALQAEGPTRALLRKPLPQRLFDNFPERLIFPRGLALRFFQQIVSNIDGCLHMAKHINLYG